MNTETNSLNLEPGERLAGVYLLQNALDAGGEPAIWLAQDEVLGKTVALHFLPTAVATDERALAEIRLEVKRTRPLIHPNILRVYDLVEGEGWAAVATESFAGRRLSTVQREHGPYEAQDLDAWLDQVCVALEEAHRIKITHRDLAPENLFVKPDGRLLLANFGIGRAVQNSLQRAGELAANSPRWSSASPQLLEAGAATPADDVYGVGALFYDLLAGQPVFTGKDVTTQIREATPPSVSDARFESDKGGEAIPPAWDNVIAACLNKNRDERPGSPAEIVSSIEAYAPVEAPAVENHADKVEEEAPAAIAPAILPAIPETLIPSSLLQEPTPAMESSAEITHQAEEEPAAAAHEPEPPSAPTEIPHEIPTMALHEEKSSDEDKPHADEAPVAAAPKKAPVVSHPLYDTEEDAFSKFLPKRFRFPAAVAAAVLFVLFLVNGAFKNDKDKPAPAHPIATSDAADRGELTTVKNAGRETPPETVTDAPAAPAQPLIDAPTPAATAKAPDQPAMIVVAGPTPKTSAPAAAPTATAPTSGPVDKVVAEKAAALEKLKADLANSEKQQQARLKEKQTAEAAVADAEKAIEAKTKAAAAAKKETEELVAARKQREDEQKAAELAAQAAQQLAAEKMKAADDAKKAFADFETKNRSKLAAQDKSDAELQTLQRNLDTQRKAADESARATTAAADARQQQLAAIDQTEKELAGAQAAAAKAAEDSQRKVAVDSERKKLDDEISAMRALFEQKMKDIEDRRRQLESGKTAPGPAASMPAPALAPTASAPAPQPPRPVATATPAPSLALMASRTDLPAIPMTTPTPASPVIPVAPPMTAGGGTNSLGLRFAPVGDVQFAIWLTRLKDFDAFARAVNLKSTAWRGPGFRQGQDHPVVNVTWNEAIAFCKWLTDKEHKEGSLPASQFYRLPYDLEWSKAVGLAAESGKTPEARDMGVPDVYPWGTDWPPPKGAGNYTGEETGSDVAIKGYDDGFAWTSPVGSFPANKIGLYDMGGNVWQWCMDSWNADSKARVLRGASWYNGALKLSLLASCRVHATPDSSTDNYGFRIVKAAETSAAKPARR